MFATFRFVSICFDLLRFVAFCRVSAGGRRTIALGRSGASGVRTGGEAPTHRRRLPPAQAAPHLLQVRNPVEHDDSERQADQVADRQRLVFLQHLLQVDEVVRGCEIALRPLIEHGETEPETVARAIEQCRYRLAELDCLCSRPLLFPNIGLFEAVEQLVRSVGAFLAEVAKTPSVAMGLWREGLKAESRSLLAALFHARQELLNG